MVTDINEMTLNFFSTLNKINKLQQSNTFGGTQMKATREHIAKAMFCGYLRREEFIDKSVNYLAGIVHAKTDIMLDQEWMEKMAIEVRGRKIIDVQ